MFDTLPEQPFLHYPDPLTTDAQYKISQFHAHLARETIQITGGGKVGVFID